MEDTNIKGMKDDNNISHNATSEISDSSENKKAHKGHTGLIVLGIITILMAGGAAWLAYQLADKQKQNEELLELAELDKQEMAMQYKDFDAQYEMLQSQLSNDSLIAQIEQERRHTQQLLEELERTKATNAVEIRRLKAEIASLRKVLQNYIMQVDSLNRINQTLTEENTQMKQQVTQANTKINNLSNERNELRDKVDIAAQLDATGFWVTPKNKKSKDTEKVKDVKKFAFGFTIVKNVTAANGERIIYARILKPDNTVMGAKGTFQYENTSLEYTEKKYIEYTGEEVKVVMYSDVTEFLEAGTYKLFVFCDKQMIGQTSFSLK